LFIIYINTVISNIVLHELIPNSRERDAHDTNAQIVILLVNHQILQKLKIPFLAPRICKLFKDPEKSKNFSNLVVNLEPVTSIILRGVKQSYFQFLDNLMIYHKDLPIKTTRYSRESVIYPKFLAHRTVHF
jgi:hypothetical protein